MSGGKDSAALAIYMRDRVPEMQYFFCDTGEELPETYEYLSMLEIYLGKPINRLNPDRDFKHYLSLYSPGGARDAETGIPEEPYLPSQRMRWCTAMLKLKPFEKWVDESFSGCHIRSYIAIRADEDREGYISHRANIEAVYPFKDTGYRKDDIFRVLEESGVGYPKYYEWRTRSGCYFCFFQRKAEWIGLKERHPDLFEKAKQYEKVVRDQQTGEVIKRYSWAQGETLEEIEMPERVEEIKRNHERYLEEERRRRRPVRLLEMFEDALDSEDDTLPCQICNL
ncbi:MAG: phosphoadenosine phosphosulfate reductase [Proteobacteria bacterium]|nr:MAG: phosphoadenosine phosphosulfate reductase [Pseudomonadota bacterium]